MPPSCIVLSAEGAKLLLPPQTIVPNKPLSDPVDLSSNGSHGISSTADFYEKTAVTSQSKSGPASETDKTNGVLSLSADPEGESAVAVTAVPVVEDMLSSKAQNSSESVDQQASLDNEQRSATADDSREVDVGRLSESCLVQIFKFLPLNDLLRASRVCSQWNAAARDPPLVNCCSAFSMCLPQMDSHCNSMTSRTLSLCLNVYLLTVVTEVITT